MPMKQMESPTYHCKSHLPHPTFSPRGRRECVHNWVRLLGLWVFCGFNVCLEAVMCLQVLGLGTYLPASAATASSCFLVPQDLYSPSAISQNSGNLKLPTEKCTCPSGLQQHYLGSVIQAWIVTVCIEREKEPFRKKIASASERAIPETSVYGVCNSAIKSLRNLSHCVFN